MAPFDRHFFRLNIGAKSFEAGFKIDLRCWIFQRGIKPRGNYPKI